MNITIQFNDNAGQIKPMHGVNNGPLGYGSLVDVSHYYKEAEFPLVRLHDPNYPHPREIDIHTIFPDFDRDPDDPASYDFAKSDYYMAVLAETGARIVWRLGESIEHTPTKYYVYPPRDYAKWARICIGIIRHYNEGWAEGFRYGISYWEIWNEPEGGGGMMWNGTDEQYFDLYRVAAPIIKAYDPTLRIGGYSAAQVKNNPTFFPQFLAMCKNESLPLDFFSWHSYNDDPELVRELSLFVREGLDRHGFTETESHYNEWNFFDADWTTLFLPGNEHYRRDLFERGKGAPGASYAAAVLATLQDCPVDEANYYDGQPSALFCGLFDYYGVPTKTYYAFRMFNELCRYGRRAAIDNGNEGVYAIAAIGDGVGDSPVSGAAALVSNYRGAAKYYEVHTVGLPESEKWVAEEYRIDAERTDQLVARHRCSHEVPLRLFLQPNTVVLLKFVKA